MANNRISFTTKTAIQCKYLCTCSLQDIVGWLPYLYMHAMDIDRPIRGSTLLLRILCQ